MFQENDNLYVEVLQLKLKEALKERRNQKKVEDWRVKASSAKMHWATNSKNKCCRSMRRFPDRQILTIMPLCDTAQWTVTEHYFGRASVSCRQLLNVTPMYRVEGQVWNESSWKKRICRVGRLTDVQTDSQHIPDRRILCSFNLFLLSTWGLYFKFATPFGGV